MNVPSTTPRDHAYLHDPTWTDVVAAYLLVAAIPVLFWAITSPVTAIGIVASLLLSHRVYRRATHRLSAALSRRSLTVRLGEAVQISIEQPPAEECCTT